MHRALAVCSLQGKYFCPQPVEKLKVIRQSPKKGLAEVNMRLDESGNCDALARIDDFLLPESTHLTPGNNTGDAVPLDQDRRILNNVAVYVPGDDLACADYEWHESVG